MYILGSCILMAKKNTLNPDDPQVSVLCRLACDLQICMVVLLANYFY